MIPHLMHRLGIEDASIGHDILDALGVPDVQRWVGPLLKDNQVSQFARLEGSKVLLHSKVEGAMKRT